MKSAVLTAHRYAKQRRSKLPVRRRPAPTVPEIRRADVLPRFERFAKNFAALDPKAPDFATTYAAACDRLFLLAQALGPAFMPTLFWLPPLDAESPDADAAGRY
ncbi:MAG: hypothetical protein ABSG86_04215 [Thermoguttaceae bacterium]|jgi:hypothetical protein